jgi:hypothetical protein
VQGSSAELQHLDMRYSGLLIRALTLGYRGKETLPHLRKHPESLAMECVALRRRLSISAGWCAIVAPNQNFISNFTFKGMNG